MSERLSEPNAIFSDSDDTLLKTVELIQHGQEAAARAEFELLKAEGAIDESVSFPSPEEYISILNQVVGGPTLDTFKRTFASVFKGHEELLDTVRFDRLNTSLTAHQNAIAPKYIEAYGGLTELLTYSAKESIPLAIVTSGSKYMMARNLGIALSKEVPQLKDISSVYLDESLNDEEKLTKVLERIRTELRLGRFTVITCDDTPHKKPHPDAIKIAAKRLQELEPSAPPIDISQAVMIGDHDVDVRMGQNAGVRETIGVTHGFATDKELEDADTTHIVDTLHNIPQLYK